MQTEMSTDNSLFNDNIRVRQLLLFVALKWFCFVSFYFFNTAHKALFNYSPNK